MTGYGKVDAEIEGWNLAVELRSVNNRFLEISTKFPREFLPYETRFRQRVQNRLARGSVFFNININGRPLADGAVLFNRETLARYLKASREISAELGIENDLSLSKLLELPDVLSTETTAKPSDTVIQGLESLIETALDQMLDMRLKEGNHMAEDMLKRIQKIEENLAWIEENLSERQKEYTQKLKNRIDELLGEVAIDETRFAQEVAYMADKLDISEEIVRFHSHNKLFRQALEEKGPHGKKLNFLLQEMGREANTLTTKSQFIEFQHRALSLKEELESLREQVANVE